MWRILIFMEGKCHEGLSVCFYKEVSDADGCTILINSCILIGNTENLPLAASLAYFGIKRLSEETFRRQPNH